MSVSPIQGYLDDLLARLRGLEDGQVADYIPELGLADPNWFGICIATHDGFVYEAGDCQQPFTIQSISKPLTYGLALEAQGESAVLQKIGVEPSGDAFNAISLQPRTGVPRNPLINAGAIAACGLVPGTTVEDKTARILDAFSRYAGRALEIDERVYASESATGHRNRAIGWMLRNFDILGEDPTPTLETYFRQCSIRVTCRDLALMGATLANGGVNPVTGVRAVQQAQVGRVLSVMATCGMYDFSGEWLFHTGLPAKSGVGGGILAVQPGRIGIAVFSPRLDAQGNSVRGIAVCRELATGLDLHLLSPAQREAPVVRVSANGHGAASRRRRPAAQAERLLQEGERLRLLHLQGALGFSSIEPLVRELCALPATAAVVLNLRSMLGIDPAAARLLAQTQAALSQRGTALLFCEAAAWRAQLVAAGVAPDTFHPDDDFALEHAENLVLGQAAASAQSPPVGLAQCELFQALAMEEVQQLESLMEARHYGPGESIISAGDASDELFVITAGTAMASLPGPGRRLRLDVFTAGMAFGEVAFLDCSPRSADVGALDDVECRVLSRSAFERMGAEAPRLQAHLLERLALGIASRLRQANRELAALK